MTTSTKSLPFWGGRGRLDYRFLSIFILLLLSTSFFFVNFHFTQDEGRRIVSVDDPNLAQQTQAPRPKPTRPSIYAHTRLEPQLLDLSRVRKEQAHAFDRVPEYIMQKAELEDMVQMDLPAASSVKMEDLMVEGDLPFERRAQRVVFFITPTYRRDTQMVDLVRLSQTLQAAAYSQTGIIYWIVIEDSDYPSQRVRNLLDRSGLPYAHVAARSTPNRPSRGVNQRNRGLKIIRDVNVDGVIYFGDDDNAYDADLITELTGTKRAAVFGVGLISHAAYERCLVDRTGEVITLLSGITNPRKFGMDMGGFAFSTAWDYAKGRKAAFDNDWPGGRQEMFFLEQIIDELADFEPLAAECTKILAWHVKTQIPGDAKIVEVPGDEDWKLVSQLV